MTQIRGSAVARPNRNWGRIALYATGGFFLLVALIALSSDTPAKASLALLEIFGLLFAFFAGVVVYFIPSIIASKKRHPHVLPIVLLNLFLGWAILGWVGALIWAVIDVKK